MSSSPSTNGAPAPIFGEIPLPPGMTLQQFQSLQGSLVTIAITAAVAFGVMIWEYLNLFPNEIELYRTSQGDLWRSPASYAFVVLRYSGLIATFPSLFFTSLQSNHCQVAVVVSQVGVILVVGASGIIFAYRVFAIWSGNRLIVTVVGVVYAGMLACWIVVAAQYRASNGPPTPFGSNCQMHPIVSWAPICNASSVLFDLVILILTVYKLSNARSRGSRVGYLIYRDSLVYFFFTAITNTVVLVIQALGPKWALVKPAVLPFSTVITATMGVRVYLNLRLLYRRGAASGHTDASTGSRSTSGGGGFGKSAPSTPFTTPPTIAMHTMVISSNRGAPEDKPQPQGPFYTSTKPSELDFVDSDEP